MIRVRHQGRLIAAMKGGDKDTSGTLRLVSAAITNRDIEARTGGAPRMTTRSSPKCMQKMIKQRRESPKFIRKGGRDDRAQTEEAEIAVIERFLPAQLSDAEAADAFADHTPRPALRRMKYHGPRHGAGKKSGSARRLSRPGVRTREGGSQLRKRPRRNCCGGAHLRLVSPVTSRVAAFRLGSGFGACQAVTPSTTTSYNAIVERAGERRGKSDLEIGRHCLELRANVGK